MSDVTRFLDAAVAGDRQAEADLLPLVYDELRKLAATKMATENRNGLIVGIQSDDNPLPIALQ